MIPLWLRVLGAISLTSTAVLMYAGYRQASTADATEKRREDDTEALRQYWERDERQPVSPAQPIGAVGAPHHRKALVSRLRTVQANHRT